MNDLQAFAGVFHKMAPWSGVVPPGFGVDFLGTLTDLRFRAALGIDPPRAGGGQVETRFPTIEKGEPWFEAVNWIEAAREARGRYVMMTLGACWGAQAVGAYRAVQLLNPMPCKLVAVEPEPENFQWIYRHMRTNGIDPDDHWLVPLALSDKNEPVFFPVGSPGTGANNCIATNERSSREIYANQIISTGGAEEAVRNIFTRNSTGLTRDLVPGRDFTSEIKLVSAVTLADILAPFDVIDYVEFDMQQSEIIVIPPFIDLLKRKVKRIHVGTHGRDVHEALHRLFEQYGWEIIFSYEPNANFSSPMGNFSTEDGILTVRNPGLRRRSLGREISRLFRNIRG